MADGGVAGTLAAIPAKTFEPIDRLIDILANGASQAFIADPVSAGAGLLLVIAILICAVLASIVRVITSINRRASERAAVDAVEALGKSSPENVKGAINVLKRFLERRRS